MVFRRDHFSPPVPPLTDKSLLREYLRSFLSPFSEAEMARLRKSEEAAWQQLNGPTSTHKIEGYSPRPFSRTIWSNIHYGSHPPPYKPYDS